VALYPGTYIEGHYPFAAANFLSGATPTREVNPAGDYVYTSGDGNHTIFFASCEYGQNLTDTITMTDGSVHTFLLTDTINDFLGVGYANTETLSIDGDEIVSHTEWGPTPPTIFVSTFIPKNGDNYTIIGATLDPRWRDAGVWANTTSEAYIVQHMIESDGANDYKFYEIPGEAYNQGMKYSQQGGTEGAISNSLLDSIWNSIALILIVFNTFLSILAILKIIFIDNLTMTVLLAEAGIWVLAMRKAHGDIFVFLQIVISYNVGLITFIVNLFSTMLKVFYFLAQIGYSILKSTPIIGNFL
jgi:hypothetical protein